MTHAGVKAAESLKAAELVIVVLPVARSAMDVRKRQ
jgi:hypothetical protein